MANINGVVHATRLVHRHQYVDVRHGEVGQVGQTQLHVQRKKVVIIVHQQNVEQYIIKALKSAFLYC